VAVIALALIMYVVERSGPNRRAVELFSGTMGLVLGAMLFAGALADGGSASWPGLIGGAVCAALGWRAVGDLIERTRARLEGSAAALLSVWADLAALVLTAVAVFVPPASILVIAAFVVLLLGGRRREGEKYAGLRVLR
jgi:hypothetical protein